MKSIVLYLHMHQPYRVKHYSIFSVDHDHDYWTDKDWYSGSNNERIFKKVAEKSYRPMLKQLGKLIETTDKFKFSLSMTGTFLEQAEEWAPDVIDSIRKLVKTGRVEIVNETYNHSLSFFVDRDEFEVEVRLHQDRVRELFGVETKVFRNTELAYNNDLAQWAESFGFKGIIAEGWDKILETRTPNKVYRPDGCNSIKLLTKNYRLSDDIAFRFSNKTWNEWPLTVDKYMRWLETAGNQGPVINLFMDFETFGENVWKDTGIFEFFNDLVLRWSNDSNHNFMTVSEACDSSTSEETISMPWTVTWADTERDLSAWLGNSMQHEALKAIYDLKDDVLASKDEELISDWRRLLTSDHLYYMSTKHLNDGGVHQYFSPYDSPFDAFLYFMNAVRDVRGRAEEYKNPKTKKKVKEIAE
ncbi:MAG: glycoside hydrolase family 57 protein [Candidatus Saccharibacteria bacterium]|nr:glycoside hydrolase family 57 protein [Candidatus Saccharibacteria bacterium]